MMTVPMDSSRPPSWEHAQRLYDKNVELENGLRQSAKSKVPSDPNAWLQMRENYEAIVLEDRDFSEEKDIEFVLWQLHYRRIEEFRQHIHAAVSTGTGSNPSASGKVLVRPDKIKKIHYVFRSFLTEATGFYHDLILKIRAKYGLPLSYFNEGIENEIVSTKDEKKLSEMQKGLLSCHRCLIYLGDLARYKGLYGEGDSVSRDFAASSSYYLQAASLCPSNGNPHHQLAILASYSADELLAVYRYFRSLAVEIPFSTARDNLIITFEKNRQSFSQLASNTKVARGQKMHTRSTGRGRGRGRGDLNLLQKDTRTETSPIKDQELTKSEIFKAFSIRFVRLHGILFTRTSLETFGEVFGSVINDLIVLLSSGPQEELNFGSTAAENSSNILRLIAIVIFTVHNVKRESENHSYAEILQRRVLLQNAFTSAFEFVGYILKRCVELQDSTSSYLLPGILLFIEWLACHQDIATSSDMEEKEEGARLFFWKHCIPFMNKLIDTGLASIDGDDDEACFFNMIRYDGEETGNRLALWEDFELRGFLPLVPAQLILDFSRKHTHMNDGDMKYKLSCVQRILAAGRALTNIVYVEQKKLYIDPSLKKFVMSTEPPVLQGNMDPTFSVLLDSGFKKPGNEIESMAADLGSTESLGVAEIKDHIYMGGEDEEEEIVFKPSTLDKYPVAKLTAFNLINPVPESFLSDQAMQGHHLASNVGCVQMSPLPNNKWFSKHEACLSNGLMNMNIADNGHSNKQVLQESSSILQPQPFAPVLSSSVSLDANDTFSNQIKAADVMLPSALDTILPPGGICNAVPMNLSAFPLKKNPVSRPVKHNGPPPGFSYIGSRQSKGGIPNSFTKEQPYENDDYNWLDDIRSSTKGMGVVNSFDQITHKVPCVNMNNTTPFTTVSTFPFPGKQVPNMQSETVNGRRWHDFQLFEQLRAYNGQQSQHLNPQQTLLPEQHQAQSLWSSRHFV